MSLILDALKKVQLKNMGESEIPTIFTAERKRRRIFPFKLLYLIATIVLALIFGSYLVVKGFSARSSAVGNSVISNQGNNSAVGNSMILNQGNNSVVGNPMTSDQQAKRDDNSEKTVEETVQNRISVEEFLPSSDSVKMQKYLPTLLMDEGIAPIRANRVSKSSNPLEPVKPNLSSPLRQPPKFHPIIYLNSAMDPSKIEDPKRNPTPAPVQPSSSEGRTEDGTTPVGANMVSKPSNPLEPVKPNPSSSLGQQTEFTSAAETKAQKVNGSEQDKNPTEQNLKINLAMNKTDYHFNIGVFYQSQGNLQKALEEYKEAARLDPSNAQAHNNMGVIYKEMKLLDEAVREYRKALSINPNYEKSLNNLGVALYLKGDLENAIKEFQQSIKINPENCASYVNLGLIFKKQGLIEDAIKTFQKTLSVDPQYPEAYYNLALTFEEIGQKEKAITYYKGFLKVAKSKHAALAKETERHVKELR